MAEDPKARREIVLITKSEEPRRDKWDTFERVSKVLSIAAIPVVIAVGGWYIQKQLQDQTVSRDYVQLAVTILKEPDDKTKIKPELRAWAVDLLQNNSPTKLSADVVMQLKSGQTILPASAGLSNPTMDAGERVTPFSIQLSLVPEPGLQVSLTVKRGNFERGPAYVLVYLLKEKSGDSFQERVVTEVNVGNDQRAQRLATNGLSAAQAEYLAGPITARAKRLPAGTKSDEDLNKLITSLLDK